MALTMLPHLLGLDPKLPEQAWSLGRKRRASEQPTVSAADGRTQGRNPALTGLLVFKRKTRTVSLIIKEE